MAHAEPERPIPAAILVGGGLVMAISLLLVASARSGLAPRQILPGEAVKESLDFRLAPAPDGWAVRRASDGYTVETLARHGNDFLPTLVQKLKEERVLRRERADGPVRLVRWRDGRVSLTDPETGRDLQLDSFGAGNAADAVHLIEEGEVR